MIHADVKIEIKNVTLSDGSSVFNVMLTSRDQSSITFNARDHKHAASMHEAICRLIAEHTTNDYELSDPGWFTI